jgi:hypothetical protein
MTGFASRSMNSRTARSAEQPSAEIDSGPGSIQETLAHARQLRARQFKVWLRRCLAEWRSLFRRPGRAVPKTYRSSA